MGVSGGKEHNVVFVDAEYLIKGRGWKGVAIENANLIVHGARDN